MERKSYIYKVTNLVNGKVYIGQSVDPIKRILQHINVRSKQGYLLNYAVKKYGIDNFLFEVIKSEVPIEQINECEIQCIKEHNCKNPNGYNLTDGGEGIQGHSHTQETKNKMRLVRLGKKPSKETLLRLSESHKGFVPSDKTREKLSRILAGHTVSDKTRSKISASKLGKKFSSSHCESIRKAKTGTKQSQETIDKRKLSNAGFKHSDETKNKLSLMKTGKCFSEKHKKSMSDSATKRRCLSPQIIHSKFRFIKNKVLQFGLDGILINEYDSINDACDKTGLGYKAINNVLTGWGKTAGNFIWKYKEKTI